MCRVPICRVFALPSEEKENIKKMNNLKTILILFKLFLPLQCIRRD